MLQQRQIAQTSFMTGPEDDLITQDVYTTTDDSVVNKTPATDPLDFGAISPISADDLRGGNALASLSDFQVGRIDVAASITSVNGVSTQSGSGGLLSKIGNTVAAAASLVGPSILSRISSGGGLSGIPGLSSVSGLSSVLNNAPAGLKSALNNPLSSSGGVFSSVGGVISRIAPANITSSYQMSNTINSLTGTSTYSIVDHDSTSSLIGNLAKSALSAGMPNAFSSVSGLAGGNSSILTSAATSLLPMIARTGNVGALKDVMSVSNISSSKAGATNLLSTLAMNYILAPSSTANDKSDQYSQITSTFSKYQPGWDSKDRSIPDLEAPTSGQVKIETSIDLTTIQSGSPDFLRTIESGAINSTVPSEKFYTAALAFKPTSPEDALKKSFPMTYTSIASQTQSNTDVVNNVDLSSAYTDYVSG